MVAEKSIENQQYLQQYQQFFYKHKEENMSIIKNTQLFQISSISHKYY